MITGLVTDSTGAVIPGAKVTVGNRETNETRSAETGGAGNYTIGKVNANVNTPRQMQLALRVSF